MKNIIGFLLLIFIVSCEEEKNQDNFILRGQVEGLKKGTLYLQKQVDSLMITVDSMEIKGSPKFELSTNLNEPEILVLRLDKNDKEDDRITFFADTGITEIKSTRKLFSFDAKINGSKQQDILEEYLKTLNAINNRNLEQLKTNFETKSSTSFSEQQENFLKRKYTYTINFALNNNDSEVAPYLAVYEIPNTTIRFLDTIYNSLTEPIKRSKYGIQLQETIDYRRENDSTQ